MSCSLNYNDVLRQIFVDVQAYRAVERRVRNLKFGPISLSLSVVGEPMEAAIMPTIEHAENGAGGGVPIQVTDFEGNEPALVTKLAESFPSDFQQVNLQSGSRMAASWDSLPRFFEMYHAESHAGMMFLSQRSLMPGWEWASPLKRILHWMTVQTPYVVVHGASLQFEDAGLLLVGHSGAGKSTTTARALTEGFISAGDDMLLVDVDGSRPTAHALYDAIKVNAAMARDLSLRGQITWRDVESHGGKKFCKISELAKGSLVSALGLNAILVPQVVDSSASRIVPGVAMDALRVLAPSTMNILRGGEQKTLAKLAKITRSLPTYRLELGSNPVQLVDLLRQFCRDLGT